MVTFLRRVLTSSYLAYLYSRHATDTGAKSEKFHADIAQMSLGCLHNSSHCGVESPQQGNNWYVMWEGYQRHEVNLCPILTSFRQHSFSWHWLHTTPTTELAQVRGTSLKKTQCIRENQPKIAAPTTLHLNCFLTREHRIQYIKPSTKASAWNSPNHYEHTERVYTSLVSWEGGFGNGNLGEREIGAQRSILHK